MKTNRFIRIFMMALDTVVLFFLGLFRKFSKVYRYEATEQNNLEQQPHAVKGTSPEVLGIQPELELDGEVVSNYERPDKIDFPLASPYTKMQGVVTFRGDNFRSGATYGTLAGAPKKLREGWAVTTGRLEKGYGKGYWTGSGWTGQPLIVRWDDQLKAVMNLYPHKKEKKGLVEAIYSTMDGNVYFIDIEDGEKTRDDLHVGLPFKGAGALDPRGIPLLYLGPGDSCGDEPARGFIYSLIDCKKLYEFGAQDPFSLRKFHGYDSSVLVSESTDTPVSYTHLIDYVSSMKSRTGQLFLKIKNYIEKNYGESSLNLKKCSEDLFLSSGYISMTLKKSTGKTFVDVYKRQGGTYADIYNSQFARDAA